MNLLVSRLGKERAAIVIDEAGGTRLAIPETLEDGGAPRALTRRFGRAIAVALVLHFAGQTIYIPNGKTAGGPRGAKLSRVVRLTRNGRSASEIASRLQCSERTVYARRAEARALELLD